MSLLEARYLGGCEIRTIQIVLLLTNIQISSGRVKGGLLSDYYTTNKVAFTRPVISMWMYVSEINNNSFLGFTGWRDDDRGYPI